MSYEKNPEIVRTTHKVSFSIGTTKRDLMADLIRVPDNAKIVNVTDDADNEVPCISFLEEREANQ
jgi:hypothetical protein